MHQLISWDASLRLYNGTDVSGTTQGKTEAVLLCTCGQARAFLQQPFAPLEQYVCSAGELYRYLHLFFDE